MSDGNWEAEYFKADNLKEDIAKYCADNKLECPKFKEHIRSWELEEIFKGLKENNQTNKIN